LSELEHVLRSVECRALITAARFKSSDYIAVIRELVPELGHGSGELNSARLPDLRQVISIAGKHDGCLTFDWILERGRQIGNRRQESVAASINPREVEEYLYQHPDIRDVQVFGVPDEKYGEELCAWIISKAGAGLDEESVRTFCRDRISHYKIPRYIRFVESFPSTVTGKVQKFAMREAMIDEFTRAPKVSA
jgi:hypothetical protein